MSEDAGSRFADAPRDAGDGLPPACQLGLARLAKLIRARPGKFQFLVLDCRDELLRDRVIEGLDDILRVIGQPAAWLRLDHPDVAAVERDLVALADTNAVIHVIGGASWFTPARWDDFNIRREAVAQRVRAALLFWLDDRAIADLAETAIDLWAWRAAVITFTDGARTAALVDTAGSPSPPQPDFRDIDNRARAERVARIDYLGTVLREPDLPDDIRVGLAVERGDLALSVGDIGTAESAYREAVSVTTDERTHAIVQGRVADILVMRGDLDEALRIRREEQLPVYERLGDVRERAVTMGKIADILTIRGQTDEALRLWREDVLPAFERQGDVRERAVTMGKIADILTTRGQTDEALRIRREEELPVYERLGAKREWAMTMGQIADMLQARGEIDEALRVRRELASRPSVGRRDEGPQVEVPPGADGDG